MRRTNRSNHRSSGLDRLEAELVFFDGRGYSFSLHVAGHMDSDEATVEEDGL